MWPFKVKCNECKHHIDEKDAQKVNVANILGDNWMEFYCLMHKRNYDRIDLFGRFYKTIPAHEIEVTKDGKEIKPKK